ncbi:MAG: dephospho-CoA kinase [Cohaesibacteraceae bacterium]|nr:dephospho-CoA kinase [Cohaesibacteraceae bacterium]MBL4875940.1 dephospho-CoA kinase [Cohaesibacteraceae bacterium]
MLKTGLTGSIGMGKTTTAEMFRQAGIPVYDADQTVHQIYGGEAVEPVEHAFPGVTIDGRINRKLLAQKLIDSPSALSILEKIVHPLVHQKELCFLKKQRAAGHRIVILDIPLLFETGRQDLKEDGTRKSESVDCIIVVTAHRDVQKKRVLARSGMTTDKFDLIMNRQLPDVDKCKRAHFLINTDQGIPAAKLQVRDVLRALAYVQR